MLALALVPVLFRLYSPQDFGVWAAVQAIAIIAGSLVSLRFDLALVLERKLDAASQLLYAIMGVVVGCWGVFEIRNQPGRCWGMGLALSGILVNLGTALGVHFDYTSAAHVRADIAARHPGTKAFEGLTTLSFNRPLEARHWLQASNPSERWKWDFMFQDLPPVKGSVDPSSLPLPPGAIALKEIK
jgi:hypothetical protein